MESTPAEDLGSLSAASFPLLVYDYGERPDNSQLMLSVADGSSRTYQVPELSNYICLETPRGLVLTVDAASLQSSIWNPQTGEKIALPVMDKAMRFERCQCLLSDTVSSPDCLVLVYDVGLPELQFCHVRGGSSWSWVSQSYDIGLYDLPESYSPPKKRHIDSVAGFQGKFYYVEAPDMVGVLSFAHDPEPHLEISTLRAPMPTIESDALQIATLTYLLESSGELFLVCLFFIGFSLERVEEVRAYRMDFDEQEWCEVTDIGDRAFLLGPENFAASCSAMEHGLKRGCVYYAFDFLGDSNDFHIFDLAEGTRDLAGPAQDIPVLSRKPFWMVPVLP